MIVGVDPGMTTGLVAARIEDEDQGGAGSLILVDAAEAADVIGVIDFILRWSPETVVIENYIIGPRPGLASPPLRIIGAVEYVCLRHGIHMVLSSPSILHVGYQRVKGTHPSKHVRSALAHVLHHVEST